MSEQPASHAHDDHGMNYATFMSTEGGRKCPMCGKYAKKGTVGNLSFTADIGGGWAHVSMYGHLPGHGCNISDNTPEHPPADDKTQQTKPMTDTENSDKSADGGLRPTALFSLAGDVARCDGVGDASLAEWREGCETCLRRTADRIGRVVLMLPPPIIAFECEYIIEPNAKGTSAPKYKS